MSAKRQRLNDSSSGSARDNRHVRRAFSAFRSNLTQMESTVTQLGTDGGGISEIEKNAVRNQLQMNGEIAEQLQDDLDELITSTREARAAQAAAEAELSRLKGKMTEHIAEAVASIEGDSIMQKHVYEEKIYSLEMELAHMREVGQGQDLPKSSPTAAKRFSSTGYSPEVSKEAYYDLIQENESLKFQLQALREERGELKDGGEIKDDASTSNNDEASSDITESSNKDSAAGVTKKKRKPPQRIAIGKYFALVSKQKYFQIKWQNEYIKKPPRGAQCNKCSVELSTIAALKDHVWVEHYKGNFKCCFCRFKFTRRSLLKGHMKKLHPGG